jgi:hypothetical protein
MSTVCFYTGPREWYRPVILEKEELYSSPLIQFEEERVRFRNPGPYDIAAELATFPAPFNDPDYVLVMLDPTAPPTSLERVRGKKICFVGDTHHGPSPLTQRIKAVLGQPWDLVALEFVENHLHWFEAVGVPAAFLPNWNVNPFWLPVPTCRKGGIVMIGQCNTMHARRRHVVDELRRRGFPVLVRPAHPGDASKLYNQATVCLNVALNGDYNHRNIEVPAAGGTLLTDASRVGTWPPLPRVIDWFAEQIDYALSHEAGCLASARQQQLVMENLYNRETLAFELRQAVRLVSRREIVPFESFWTVVADYELQQEARRTNLEV